MNKVQLCCPTKLLFHDWKEYFKDQISTSNTLLVTTPGFKARGMVDEFIDTIGKNNILILDEVEPNPSINQLQVWIERFNSRSIKSIISLGGGSAIDTGKVLSFFIDNSSFKNLSKYLFEGLKKNNVNSIPLIVIPTTAGSGAEVTPFATIWDKGKLKKYSIYSESIRPKIALLDYKLTLGLPIDITITSGLDTLSHGFESIWNKNATKETRGIATLSISLALQALPRLINNPKDLEARKNMQKSSCFAGVAISTTKTALAHAISYPLTSNYLLPHGLACSFTLIELLLFNSKEDDGRLLTLSRELGFKDIEHMAQHLKKLFLTLNIYEKLKIYLPTNINDILALKGQMNNPERAVNNMRHANQNDVEKLLKDSLKEIF
tara:strand:+ start:23577 stop:24713 length:1137 start_codon:yes stop_codon:yes gene_type:complete